MWLVFLCMPIAYLIQRHWDHKKATNELVVMSLPATIPSQLSNRHETDIYDLTYKST